MSEAAMVAVTQRLVDDASALFRPAGRFAWHFARGKLARDPLFTTLLRTGAIPDAACLVDLGCGQGLLAAWLFAARARWMASASHADWPTGWPAPPKVGTWLGIDQSRRDIARAHKALPPFARSFRADVRKLGTTLLDRCDVVVLLDVLQYLAPAAQERLLDAVRAGLPPWGIVLLRVGDGAASSASRWSNAIDLVVCAARGHPRLRLHRRPLVAWIALLERLGFSVEVLDDGRGDGGARDVGFANALLRASRIEPHGPTASTSHDEATVTRAVSPVR